VVSCRAYLDYNIESVITSITPNNFQNDGDDMKISTTLSKEATHTIPP
jgi:hypothetical protein